MLNYIDNFLSEEENRLLYEECLKIDCKWGAADISKRNKFPRSNYWHFWTGNIEDKHIECNKLLNKVKEQLFLNEYKIFNFYINCQMIGDESPIHADLSDITVLYYPNLNWKIDWDGGTIFYKNDKSDSIGLLSYIPKRLVFYSGKILHKPATISKYADQQRIVIVIKLNKS